MTRDLIETEYSAQDRKTWKNCGTIVHDFPARDTKGRQFGAAAYLFEVSYVRVVDKCWFPDRMDQRPVGRYFGFSPQALRDGKKYGASQGYTWFPTPEARDKAVDKYFIDAEKRALKNKARAA